MSELSEWHEKCIEHLLRRSGIKVEREPIIDGKNPDLLVQQPEGPNIVIECLLKEKNSECQAELDENQVHICGGDIAELHSNLYSRVEKKASKYHEVTEGIPYLIALYNDECMNDISTAKHLAFSAWMPYVTFDDNQNVIETGWKDAWSTAEQTASLFKLHPNVSGMIYSRWERKHYLIPNPFANEPISSDLFPFAQIPRAIQVAGKPAWKERAALINDDYISPPHTYWRQIERLIETISKHEQDQHPGDRN